MASSKCTPAASFTSRARLFDTHCHIGLIRREREKIQAGLLPTAMGPLTPQLVYDARDKANGAFKLSNVQRYMLVGIDAETSQQAAFVTKLVMDEGKQAIALGELPPSASVWAGYSVGIHPHYAQDFDKHWPTIASLAREGCVIDPRKGEVLRPHAIGESGLDYFKSTASADQQKHNLKAHVVLAQELNLPLIIHCRDAYDDLFKCFEEWGVSHMKGVLHCYSSGIEHMLKGAELGLKISFPATITYPKSHELRDACAQCPPNAIVFETDSPFLPPQRNRGGINVPAHVADAVECAAKVRNEDPVSLAETAWKNSCELFQIAP